jgi:hypothetical protein
MCSTSGKILSTQSVRRCLVRCRVDQMSVSVWGASPDWHLVVVSRGEQRACHTLVQMGSSLVAARGSFLVS